MSREGVPLLVIQRQLGHANLSITSVYLRGIDNTEIIHTVHERPAPPKASVSQSAHARACLPGGQMHVATCRLPSGEPVGEVMTHSG